MNLVIDDTQALAYIKTMNKQPIIIRNQDGTIKDWATQEQFDQLVEYTKKAIRFDPTDCGGVYDGVGTVTSDADEGL